MTRCSFVILPVQLSISFSGLSGAFSSGNSATPNASESSARSFTASPLTNEADQISNIISVFNDTSHNGNNASSGIQHVFLRYSQRTG